MYSPVSFRSLFHYSSVSFPNSLIHPSFLLLILVWDSIPMKNMCGSDSPLVDVYDDVFLWWSKRTSTMEQKVGKGVTDVLKNRREDRMINRKKERRIRVEGRKTRIWFTEVFCVLLFILGSRKNSSLDSRFGNILSHVFCLFLLCVLFSCWTTTHDMTIWNDGLGIKQRRHPPPDEPWHMNTWKHGKFNHEWIWCSGEQNGYNIPEVVSFPDLRWWLSEEGTVFLLTTKDDKLLPEMARRLLCDAYMCFYQSTDQMVSAVGTFVWFIRIMDGWMIIKTLSYRLLSFLSRHKLTIVDHNIMFNLSLRHMTTWWLRYEEADTDAQTERNVQKNNIEIIINIMWIDWEKILLLLYVIITILSSHMMRRMMIYCVLWIWIKYERRKNESRVDLI